MAFNTSLLHKHLKVLRNTMVLNVTYVIQSHGKCIPFKDVTLV